jgi:hypothetical protein
MLAVHVLGMSWSWSSLSLSLSCGAAIARLGYLPFSHCTSHQDEVYVDIPEEAQAEQSKGLEEQHFFGRGQWIRINLNECGEAEAVSSFR